MWRNKKLIISLTVGLSVLMSGASNAYAATHSSDEDSSASTTSLRLRRSFGILRTTLSGSEEVPGPGDLEGKGPANLRIYPEQSKACIHMYVADISPATAAHIHKAPKGSAGPAVVHLPVPNAWGFSAGCVSIDKDLGKNILEHPSDYYINVHNSDFPEGAVRGQL